MTESAEGALGDKGNPADKRGSVIGEGVDERLEALERGDKALRGELSKLHRAVKRLSGSIGEGADERRPILKDVYNAVRARTFADAARRESGGKAGSESAHRGKGERRGGVRGRERASSAAQHGATGVMSVGVILSLGAVLALALALLRRWRRASAKGLKSR